MTHESQTNYFKRLMTRSNSGHGSGGTGMNINNTI